MASHGVRFVAFANYNEEVLARLINGWVIANWAELRPDFPSLNRKYGTPTDALASVERVIREVRESGGTYGVFIVVIDNIPYGVASFSQTKLHRWEWRRGIIPWRYCIADGPLLAVWLARTARTKDSDPRRVLPDILLEAARVLEGANHLHGHPFTFVRAARNDDGHVGLCLADEHNGFGGFSPGSPADFSSADGVTALRRMWTANRRVEFCGPK